MRVLVTGGAGFIGSHLVETLVRKGHEVAVADNLTMGTTENLASVMDEIDFRVLDVAQPEQAKEAVKGVDAVLHHAALASVQASVDDPVGADRINVAGTVNMLEASRLAGVKRFVFAASAAAYGDDPSFPKIETQAPKPLSPYAVAKIAGEYYCSVFWRLYGLRTICLRYFNVFGPRQNPKSEYAAVIPKFIARMLDGCPPTIYGDGEQTRDFIYVGDVARANLLALEAEQGFGEVVNAAGGRSFSLNQLFGAIRGILGSDLEPIYEAAREGDIKNSLADIGKAKDVLGYEPSVSLEDGLRRTIEWFQTSREAMHK